MYRIDRSLSTLMEIVKNFIWKQLHREEDMKEPALTWTKLSNWLLVGH